MLDPVFLSGIYDQNQNVNDDDGGAILLLYGTMQDLVFYWGILHDGDDEWWCWLFPIYGFHWCFSGRLEGWWSIQLLEGRSTSLQGVQLANIMEYEEIKEIGCFFFFKNFINMMPANQNYHVFSIGECLLLPPLHLLLKPNLWSRESRWRGTRNEISIECHEILGTGNTQNTEGNQYSLLGNTRDTQNAR